MDILIKNANLYLKRRNKLVEKDILIEENKIKEIGNIDRSNSQKIDCSGKLILPGFIDTHFHLGESIYRDIISPDSTREYIEVTEELWDKVKNKDIVRNATLNYSLLQLIKNGTTCFVTGRSWENIEKSRLRALSGYPLMSSKKLKDYLKEFSSKFETIKERFDSERLEVGFWLHSLVYTDEETLKLVSQEMQKFPDSFLTVHIDEARWEREFIEKRYGKPPIHVLDDFGLLNERTLLVHCNYIQESELSLVEEKESKISICPTSALGLQNKLPPIDSLLERKIDFSIGSDNLVVSEICNLLEIVRTAVEKFESLSYSKGLELITTKAARCLGLGNKIGSLNEGKIADLLFFDLYDLKEGDGSFLENLVLSSPQPTDVMVGGEFLMRKNKVSVFNEEAISYKFKRMKKNVRKNI